MMAKKSQVWPLIVGLGIIAIVRGKPTENGQSLVGRDGVIIDCRTEHDSYFPDPDDCRSFYHCSDWAGLERKSCGTLFFHPQKRVCDWPYIVRRIRHDCPADDNLPDLHLEVVNPGQDSTPPPFDDGSYVEFEPEPENKFRFPTAKPRPKTKKPDESVFEKNVKEFQRAASSSSDIKNGRKTLEIRVPKKHEVKTLTTPRDVVLVKLKPEPEVVSTSRPTVTTSTLRSRGSVTHASRVQAKQSPIVKSLPTRNIVKSLPEKPTTFRSPVPNARRPFTFPTRTRDHPASTSRTPVRNRFVSAADQNEEEEEVEEIETEDPFLICTDGECFEPTEEPRSTGSARPVVDLFQNIADKKKALEKKKIQRLLEAAKVEGEEDTTTELSDETTILDEEITTTESSTEEEDSGERPTSIPFKTADERPDFLDVLKKKAELIKDQLFGNATEEVDEEEDDDTEGPTVKVTVVKSTSSSIGGAVVVTVVADQDDITTEAVIAEETTSDEEVEEETTSTTQMETTLEPVTEEVIEEEDSTEELVTESDEEEVTSVDEQQVISEKPVIIEPSAIDNVLKNIANDDEDEDESEVFVVQAVPHVPKAEPFVAEDTNDFDSAEQESKIHTTTVEKKPEEEPRLKLTLTSKTEGLEPEPVDSNHHPSSLDMVMTILDHLNLHAIMEHMAGGPKTDPEVLEPAASNLVPSTEALIQTTTTTSTSTSTVTTPTTRADTTTTTTTTTTTAPTTSSTDQITSDQLLKTEAPASTKKPLTTKKESVHIVLPEGYTTTDKSTTPWTKKYHTIIRATAPATINPTTTSTSTTDASTSPTTSIRPSLTFLKRISTTQPIAPKTTSTSSTTTATTASTSSTSTTTRKPFVSSLDRIRQRLQKPVVTDPRSTQSFLASLNAKSVSDAVAKEAEKKSIIKPSLKKFFAEDTSEEEKAAIAEAKLAEIRKQLFSSRAKVNPLTPILDDKSPRPTVQIAVTSNPYRPKVQGQSHLSVAEKIRQKIKQRTSGPGSDLATSESRLPRPLVRQLPALTRGRRGGDLKYQSIRCRLLRGSC